MRIGRAAPKNDVDTDRRHPTSPVRRPVAQTGTVPDVLSSGFPEQDEDAWARPPAYRPRWLSAVAVLAVAAVLAVLAVRQGTGRPDTATAAPTRTIRVIPAPPPTPTPPTRPRADAGLRPAPVHRLDGDPGVGPAGVRLVVGGREPGVLDAGTGLLTPLPAPGLGSGEGVLVRRGAGYTITIVGFNSRPQARAWLVPDGGGAAVDLGDVQDLLPRRDGSVLTEFCTPDPPLCSLAARSRTGAPLWTRRLGSFVELVGDTPYGVLVSAHREDGRMEPRLIEPRTGAVRREFGRVEMVLGASGRRVAWRPAGCDSNCPVVVADLADGRTRRLPAVAGRSVTGAFSPDSQRLAVGFMGLDPNDPDLSRQRDGYAAVLDLGNPGWVRAPGLTTGVKSAPVPVWTPAGDRLLLGTADAGQGRVAVWRPGDARLTVLPTRLVGFDAVPAEFALA